MTVGERIKQRRIELQLSQEALAKLAGYNDKTAISKLEHAGNEITLKQIKRIASALKVSNGYLLGWDGIDGVIQESPMLSALQNTGYDNIEFSVQVLKTKALEKLNIEFEEISLIEKYRLLDDRGKRTVLETIERELSYSEQ